MAGTLQITKSQYICIHILQTQHNCLFSFYDPHIFYVYRYLFLLVELVIFHYFYKPFYGYYLKKNYFNIVLKNFEPHV